MKTVIIIGASGAIGKEMVKSFYKKGYNVFAGFNNNKSELEGLLKTLTEKKNRIVFEGVDLTDEKSIASFFAKFKSVFGVCDCLVNCAGVSYPNLLIDVKFEQLLNEINVNLVGTILACKSSIDCFGDNGGSIVNMASIWGVCGGAFESTYSAPKGGIIAFSKALAKEIGSKKIRVNTISPGLIKSPMNAHLTKFDYASVKHESPLNRLVSAKEVADCALFLASDGAKNITGQNITIDAGFIL